MDFLIRILFVIIVYLFCSVLYNKGIVQHWAFFVFMGYVGSAIGQIIFVLQQSRDSE